MQILEQAQDLPQAGNIKAQWVSLWTGPVVGVVLVVAALAFPGFWPPMSPTMTADQVAAFYAEHTAWIRLSQVTFNLCGIMILPFLMVIVAQMKRMKGQSHVFAYCYLTAVVSGTTIFALSNIFFLVAAFRPERNPDLILLLNDLAWIVFIAPVGMVVSQFVLLALAVYFDSPVDPVFPRWVGHFSLAVAAAMVPAAGAAVFVVVMFFVLRTAIRRQAVDDGVVAP